MYDIVFYQTSSGNVPFEDFLGSFDEGDVKNVAQIRIFLNMLEEYGPNINRMYKRNATKKLDNDIFELKPGNNRVLFFYHISNKIVVLHGFKKKTNKTPRNEIDKAKKEMLDYRKRHYNE